MTTVITAAGILAFVGIAASLGESISDRYAGGITPGVALLTIALIIGDAICH